MSPEVNPMVTVITVSDSSSFSVSVNRLQSDIASVLG